jgi:hypothetical protein
MVTGPRFALVHRPAVGPPPLVQLGIEHVPPTPEQLVAHPAIGLTERLVVAGLEPSTI